MIRIESDQSGHIQPFTGIREAGADRLFRPEPSSLGEAWQGLPFPALLTSMDGDRGNSAFHALDPLTQQTIRGVLDRSFAPSQENVIQAMLAGRVETYEETIQAANGVFLKVIANSVKLSSEETNIQLVAVDVTAEKLREEELRQKIIRLEITALNEVHRMKGSIGAPFGYLQMAARSQTPDSARQAIEAAQRTLAVISKRAEAFPDRLQASGELNLKPMDLVNFLQDLSLGIIKSARASEGMENLNLIFNTTEKPVNILGDEEKLASVFENLLNNAVFAMKGCLTKSVAINFETNRDGINIFVQDTGGGIPKDIQDSIFEKGRTTKTQAGGNGIGLYTAKHIIEAHRGTIILFETGLEGTTFRVFLPFKQKGYEL